MPDSGHDSHKLASPSLHGVYTPSAKLYPVFTPRSVTCRCLQWSPRLPGAHPPFCRAGLFEGSTPPGEKKRGSRLYRALYRDGRADLGARPVLRRLVGRRAVMSWLYWLSGLTAAFLFVYLLVALFKPEKF